MKKYILAIVLLIQISTGEFARAEEVTASTKSFSASFDNAPIGVWRQVGRPHGWSSSHLEKTETMKNGFIRLGSGVVVTSDPTIKVHANTCYRVHASLGASKGDVVRVILYATQNQDGTGKSIELACLQKAGIGGYKLQTVSLTNETVSSDIEGYYLRVKLEVPNSGEGYFGAIEIISLPMEKEFVTELVEKGIECVEFYVPVENRIIKAMICSPPEEQLNPDPVLLMAMGGASSNFLPSNLCDQSAQYFWERGHRTVSFSDPVFASLESLRDSVLAGEEPFSIVNENAQAVLKYCIDRKWARSGRIVVVGVSRYAYFAFRLMAADEQLCAGGGFSPVTDWRDLLEFHEQRHQKRIADLDLSLFADKLAGKKICLAIGNHDERVNTLSCCQFFLDLNRENEKRGFDRSYVDFYCTPDPHHTCGDEWYQRSMENLLNWMISKR